MNRHGTKRQQTQDHRVEGLALLKQTKDSKTSSDKQEEDNFKRTVELKYNSRNKPTRI